MLLIYGAEKDSWESLGLKEIKPTNPTGNQPWLITGRTDAEVEAPVLWPLDVKSWLGGKAPDGGKDWRQEEKGTAEDVTDSLDMSLSKLWEIMEDRGAWHAGVPGAAESRTGLSNWTQQTATL